MCDYGCRIDVGSIGLCGRIRAVVSWVFSFCFIFRVVWFCLIVMVGVVWWFVIFDCLLIAECSVRLVRVLFNVFDMIISN